MKKLALIILLLLSTSSFASFENKASSTPYLVQKGKSKLWCPITGMKISDYYRTSYIAKLQINDTQRQYSSILALILDMQAYGIDMKSIKVVDFTSQNYIEAKDAFFVINSKIKINFIKSVVFAFEKKEQATRFIKKNKGQLVDFQTALTHAKKNLASDLIYLKKIYKKKIYSKGKKIFEKKCNQDIDMNDFFEINELKANLFTNCKNLSEKHLQTAALYLWDIKRKNTADGTGAIVVNDGEKCPVCGMFTYKYPKWVAQIFYMHEGHEHHFSFDGVKDLMKFYFDPMAWGNYNSFKIENISKILVTDYYMQKAIEASKAFYVLNSDIYGPMGHELIPFENLDDAKTFMDDHRGKKILNFKEINLKEIGNLDE